MKQSAELQDLITRIYQALATGDQALLERHLARQEGVLVIGTDPAEWWEGHATIMKAISAQTQEMGGGMPIVLGTAQAFHEGTVGWAADQSAFLLPDGTNVPFRSTFVFHQEGGTWTIVQWHISVGARNEEVVGKELTT